MELKPGYKQTEVGVIPEDWGIDVIKNAYEIRNDLRLPLSENVRKKMQGPYPYYGPTKVQDYINEYRVEGEYCLIGEDGDHFLKWKDMPMTLLVREKFNVNNHAHLVCGIRNETTWFYYYFKNRDITRHLTRQGAGRYKLTKGTLENIPLAIPSTKAEQTAISNALSDADALIQSLTRLIAKKRQIKQGAMQTLLNPYENGRLKAGWVVKTMPEVCWFQEGPGVRNSQFTRSGVKLLNGTNIDQGELFLDKTDRYISEKEAYGWYSHFLADEGDIVIACSGITVEKFHEKVTVLRKEHLPLCMNTSTMRFKVTSKELLHSYLIHFLRSRVFKEQIGGKATGSAQLNFGPSHVNAVEMALPPINEQTCIATILSDMDAEIAALEAKLAKYQQIKQGMMQNLLTGKIRLI